jgi:hypothetical protein
MPRFLMLCAVWTSNDLWIWNLVDDTSLHRVPGLSSSLHFSLLTPEITMGTALDISKQAYEAFGRRDIPA